MRVELDKKALFALASDTRLEILRSLQPMRRTVKQLAEALGIDKAAVHRHLKKLVEGGLVKRYVDHGFVYYGLNRKGRDLLNPNERTKIVILISSSIVFLALAAFVLILAQLPAGLVPDSGVPTQGRGEALSDDLTEGPFVDPTLGQAADLRLVLLAVFAMAVATLLLVTAVRTIRRPKQRLLD